MYRERRLRPDPKARLRDRIRSASRGHVRRRTVSSTPRSGPASARSLLSATRMAVDGYGKQQEQEQDREQEQEQEQDREQEQEQEQLRVRVDKHATM